jgi:hypothetical protein
MSTLREGHASDGVRVLAPLGQFLGEPRFRWEPAAGAWLYRIELTDAAGREVGRGWSGMHELPLAWLRGPEGDAPSLHAGQPYRWRVYAYEGPPTGGPSAASAEAEFWYLGP